MLNIPIIRLIDDAIIPVYAKPGDAGLDLTAVDVVSDHSCLTYKTGLAIEIPLRNSHIPYSFKLSISSNNDSKVGRSVSSNVNI